MTSPAKHLRILVVEDHVDLAANLCDFLKQQNWQPEHAPDGRVALQLLERHRYDVIILDLTLPYVDGLDVARTLGERGVDTPILMLTARDTIDDRLDGFDAGADDFLIKPFSLRELAARINVLSRRRTGPTKVLSVGELTMDMGRGETWRGERKLRLSPTETEILALLMRRSPRLVSRSEIEQQVWGEEPPESGALRTHVYMLRKELETALQPTLLHTVRGMGYRLEREREGTN